MTHINRIISLLILMCLVSIPAWTFGAAEETTSSIEQTFQKAKQDYLDKNYDAAAAQIKKGAVFMKEESINASDKGKAALADSARELEKLSEDVKKGTVKSVKKIEDAFGRAYYALAWDAHVKSTEAWAKKESAKAGEYFNKAANYLETGFLWTSWKIETGTKKVIIKSKELSVKMKEKSSEVTEDIGKEMKKAGNEIEKFGRKISAR